MSVLPPAFDDPRTRVKKPGVSRPASLKALTSIRFFAALHVALYHLVRPFSKWGPLGPAMENGYSGVSFFFVLSGFILTYAHAADYERGLADKGRFWIARLARIYPVYFVSLLVAVLLELAALRNPLHWIALAADFAMMQAWSMRMVNFFNSGAWTLSCEAFFYFVFPFLLLPLRPRSRSAGLAWLGGFFLLAIAAPMILVWHYPGAASTENFLPQPGANATFLVSRSPLFAVPQFLAGMSVGWLYLRFKPSQRTGAWLAAAGALLFTGALFFSNHLPYLPLHNGLLIPVYALLLLGLCQSNWLTRALSGSWLVLLGEASFAFYLFHILVITFTERFGVQHTFTSAAWRLLIAIPLSIAIHLWIERPCRRAILAWWVQRRASSLRMESA